MNKLNMTGNNLVNGIITRAWFSTTFLANSWRLVFLEANTMPKFTRLKDNDDPEYAKTSKLYNFDGILLNLIENLAFM